MIRNIPLDYIRVNWVNMQMEIVILASWVCLGEFQCFVVVEQQTPVFYKAWFWHLNWLTGSITEFELQSAVRKLSFHVFRDAVLLVKKGLVMCCILLVASWLKYKILSLFWLTFSLLTSFLSVLILYYSRRAHLCSSLWQRCWFRNSFSTLASPYI